jgi:hypothetical protein
MGHNAAVDYNLTLCTLQSRLQHIYHWQPYATVNFIPQSGTFDLASDNKSLVVANKILRTCFSQ